MSYNNNCAILLQRHAFTFAGTCAYRSRDFAVVIETRVQAAVRVIAHQSKLIDTADLGISGEYNLAITLRDHAVAAGARVSSHRGMGQGQDGGETYPDVDAEESDGTFHFTSPIWTEEIIDKTPDAAMSLMGGLWPALFDRQ